VFGTNHYLRWVNQHYGRAPFDLATSGVPAAPLGELGISPLDLDSASTDEAFHAAIAHYNDVPVSEVVPALGTAHALFLAYAALLSPGDELLVERPGYEPLARTAEGLGALVHSFDRPEAEGFRIDPSRVARAMTPRTRAVVVTNLHNPSGVRTDSQTLIELSRMAESHGAFLIVNEVYGVFDALAESGIFPNSARKLAPNVIAVGSLTKAYGLGSQRIGWVLAPPTIAERATKALIATCGHLPASHASLGVAALSATSALSRRARNLFAGKRAVAEAWVRRFPHARWSSPSEGLFGFVTLPGEGDLRPKIESLLERCGVLVGAGVFFGVPNGFRLSWASLPKGQFEEGLSRLESLVLEKR
jgi:aspartate/methionine/tyrosine aminotransferase